MYLHVRIIRYVHDGICIVLVITGEEVTSPRTSFKCEGTSRNVVRCRCRTERSTAQEKAVDKECREDHRGHVELRFIIK